MARPILLLLVAMAALSAAALRAQEGSATGELVRSGDVPYDETNRLRRTAPPELMEARLADDAPAEPPATLSISAEESAPLPSKSNASQPRRLAARGKSGKPSATRSTLNNPTESLITMGGSLCVVLSLFFGLAWLTRRGMPKGLGKLPGEVIEVLGKVPLVKGQELQLVRVGAKLLLICVTPSGCETLTEIVDRSEVDRLSTICRTNGPSSMTAAFNQVLTGVGREPASGFAGSARTSTDRRGGRSHA